tara:strand:- start:368 stop:580 length:213 start_codon:yes stop_codon:yes gene_type:complete
MASNELLNLVENYKYVFGTTEGQEVLDDIRNFSQIDNQAGTNLTHAECAYRNGIQDLYRYIQAMQERDND